MLSFTKLVLLVFCIAAVIILPTSGDELIKTVSGPEPSLAGFLIISNFYGNVLSLTNSTTTPIVNGTSVTAMPISGTGTTNQQVNTRVYSIWYRLCRG